VDGPHARPDPPLLGEPLPVELMNTIWADRDGVHDALATTAGVAAWLEAVGDRVATQGGARVGPVTGTPRLARELRQLRDALRRLAAIATGDDRPAAASAITDLDAAVAAVNRACAHAPSWSRLTWPAAGEPRRDTQSAQRYPDVVRSVIAEQGVALFTGADRTRLRACHAPGCVLYFVRDHPRREWCGDACGNRARVARHYRRHRGDAAG
jgi:predicted RNA-binding Zn ribbon-like protein